MDKNEAALLEFLKDIDVLQEVEKFSNQFNVFEILGVVNTEIRHSNMLAWLLNPKEIHGLDESFIKKLIQIYINSFYKPDYQKNTFKLLLSNFEDVIVLREWNNIDLLVISEQNKTVITIENKIWSKESQHQLKKYQQVIEREFPDYEKLFIFLTPNGDEASDIETWHPISYKDISEGISETLVSKENTLSKETSDFIKQYLNILRRYILGDEELEKICNDIYFKHKRALDLIFEYKPDILNDISEMLQKLIIEKETLVADYSSKRFIRFTTQELDKKIPLNETNNKWTASRRMLLIEVKNIDKATSIHLVVGPADTEIREHLHEIAVSNEKLFKGARKNLTGQYTNLFSKTLYKNNPNEELSHTEILEKTKRAFEKFIDNDLPKLEDVLIQNFRHPAKNQDSI